MHKNKPTERIYCSASAYFDSVITAINTAKEQIDMEVYIFSVDPIGKRVAEALMHAAQRGVSVRLLVDGMGADLQFTSIAKQLRDAGIRVRIHRPLPWHVKQWTYSLSASQGLQKFWYLLSYINQRNHRKLLIVDHLAIWLGSMNVSQQHFTYEEGGENWRDTAISIHNIETKLVQAAYNLNWSKRKRSTKKYLIKQLPASPFSLNFSRALRQSKQKNLLAQIAAAQDLVWITNAYFIPDAKLLSAITAASKRGVDVRVILPQQSDVFFMPWVASFFYSQLLNSQVRIYEYQTGILHAKTVIIDNWASIGSSNFNQRSFKHDLEVDYAVQSDQCINQLRHEFLNDIKHSEELYPATLKTTKTWRRFLGGLILILFSNWL